MHNGNGSIRNIRLKIRRQDGPEPEAVLAGVHAALPTEYECYLLLDGDSAQSRRRQWSGGLAACVGSRVSGAGVRYLHDGCQRDGAAIMRGAD